MRAGVCLALVAVLVLGLLGGCAAVPAETSAATAQPAAAAPEDDSFVPNVFRRNVDFGTLQGENQDIIGWIEVPETNIDYPVLCTSDNAFYLNHDEYGEYDTYGAIFIDMSNAPDFSSPVTVAYGHYTPDETHFTQLHKYEDRDFFDTNKAVYVYTPGHQQTYEVVAAFLADDRNVLFQKDYSTPDGMQEFIDWMAGTRGLEANINLDGVTAADKFLMLSTCTQEAYHDGYRYVVVAKLVNAI